jgi:hypothetical protein
MISFLLEKQLKTGGVYNIIMMRVLWYELCLKAKIFNFNFLSHCFQDWHKKEKHVFFRVKLGV